MKRDENLMEFTKRYLDKKIVVKKIQILVKAIYVIHDIFKNEENYIIACIKRC